MFASSINTWVEVATLSYASIVSWCWLVSILLRAMMIWLAIPGPTMSCWALLRVVCPQASRLITARGLNLFIQTSSLQLCCVTVPALLRLRPLVHRCAIVLVMSTSLCPCAAPFIMSRQNNNDSNWGLDLHLDRC